VALEPYIYSTLLLLFGFLIAKVVSQKGTIYLEEKFLIKNSLIVKRFLFYGILALFLVTALKQLGFELGVLLGAAGVFSVAIGFASQTSMSNVISGMFLLGEGTVAIGDTIKVGNTVGEVISIDWLSIKLRTPENLFVRLPNEVIIKSEMTNLSQFKIRRFDLYISVAYHEDLALVKQVLLSLVKKESACLDDPEPMIVIEGFGESGVNIRLAVWAKSEEFLKFKSSMNEKVKAEFDMAGIEIPFPHISLYAGDKSQPIEVAVINRGQEKGA
jgi:small-conductance mechanosensitive channel